MARITDSGHARRLRKMASPAAKSLTDRALYAAGDLVKTEMQILIVTGSITGKGHVASKPGDPPNADTRDLDSNIFVVPVRSGRVDVEATSDHAVPLQFGTSKMEARPFADVALRKRKDEAIDLIKWAVAKSAE